MRLSRLFSLFFFLISFHFVNAQTQNSIVFYELIENDSVALYFNKHFMFTEKECFDYVRKVRVTKNGDFNSYFEDRGVDGKLLGKGAYSNGLKHGYFETFHSNGRIFSRGYYENDKPVGNWEYYYPSGVPERTISIQDSTVLLMQFIDPTGTVRVKDGNGSFSGIIGVPPKFHDMHEHVNTYGGVRVIGEVVDGRAEGKWIIPDSSKQAYYMEKFRHGMLIRTSRTSKRKMSSKTQHYLDSFFLSSYLPSLETFQRENCNESQQYFFNQYPTDFRIFSNDLRQKLNYLIATDLRSDRKNYYAIGDNSMIVQFSVNEKGKPYDIQLVSEWGHRFLAVVKNSINKTVFSTNTKTMYFHLKLSNAGGYRYKYNFRFSKRTR